MTGVHRYLLLWVCFVAFILKETSCASEVSEVNTPDRSSETRKRRYLIYPHPGSFAEVMTPLGLRHIPKLLQIYWYFNCSYLALPDKKKTKERDNAVTMYNK